MNATLNFAAVCLALAPGVTQVSAQSYDRSDVAMLSTLEKQPNLLARYQYLTQAMPKLSPASQNLARQFESFSLNELGVYNQAVFSFPLKIQMPVDLTLPDQDKWQGAEALETISKLAADHRIVMINEAHHNAHTRVLTLALLPRLKALGFKYFAIEALTESGADLEKRGYPVNVSGTEYLQEPLYGDIVREAIRLGYVIVSYDSSDSNAPARESHQAKNLFDQVFKKDPEAHLLVHAGYAHIDKAPGRLGRAKPMAMQLQALTGLNPLSIDQTQFLETNINQPDEYHALIKRFPCKSPEVLIQRSTGRPWSASPKLYDVNVILPPALSMSSFGNENAIGRREDNKTMVVNNPIHFDMYTPVFDFMQRPAWLTLGGQRHGFRITTALCRTQIPCVIDAHYANEPSNAVAADRYAFMKAFSSSKLFLRPGRYRLRAWNIHGVTLSEQMIDVK